MKKIMWLSDSPYCVTGYANQSFNILNRLSDEYETHFLAHNFIGQSQPAGNKTKDGTVYNFQVHGSGKEQYCKDIMTQRIKEMQVDYFGILLDTFMLYPWLIQQDLSPAKTFFYFPSDGGAGMPLGCDAIIRKMSRCIAMSKYAQKQVKEYYNLDVDYIPHGVDASLFYPMSQEDRAKLRSEVITFIIENNGLVPVRGALKDKFVIGVVARNQGRKMIDRTFKTMALLREKLPNAVLLMHSDPYDAAAVFNMVDLIQRYKLQNRVFFTGMNFFRGIDYKDMNKVYNLMDCFYLSTSGEGFGIPTVEAMAAGIPVAVTNYTTTKELVYDEGQCGYGIKLVGTEDSDYEEGSLKLLDDKLMNGTITGNWDVERGICDIKDAADKLEILGKNPELCKRFGMAGRNKVLMVYDWNVVMPKWREFFRRLGQ
jgi:glycosyltransferase involved in cell wall biosynthesis